MISNYKKIFAWSFLTILLLLPSFNSFADSPLPPAPVGGSLLFGLSTALTGRESEIGNDLVIGISTAFRIANDSSSLKGRKLELLALDDSFDPRKTARNLRKMADDYKIIATIGSTGAHALPISIPIAKEKEVLLLAPYGNHFFRTPQSLTSRYLVFYRPSITEELAALVTWMVNVQGIPPNQIALVSQRDSFGDAAYTSLLTALSTLGLSAKDSIPHYRYERGSFAVESTVADLVLAKQELRAVVFVGTYPSAAQFIRVARQSGLQMLFAMTSIVGANSLNTALGSLANGIVMTQVVPDTNSNLPLVAKYRRDLKSVFPSQSFSTVSLEGYLIGSLVVKVIDSMKEEVTREGFINALDNLGEFDLGLAASASISPYQHQLSNSVYGSWIKDGELTPFDWNQKIAIPLAEHRSNPP